MIRWHNAHQVVSTKVDGYSDMSRAGVCDGTRSWDGSEMGNASFVPGRWGQGMYLMWWWV